MTHRHARPVLALIAAALWCVAVAAYPDAEKRLPIERFFARAPSTAAGADAADRIEIMIERWSSDQDRAALCAALAQGGEGTLLTALQQLRRAGVVMMPGVLNAGARVRARRGQNLLFAQDLKTPEGRRVVIAADQHVGFGEPSRNWPSGYEFTLIDIRFGPDGTGVGKLASPGQVACDKQAGRIEVADYAAQAARLTEVRSAVP